MIHGVTIRVDQGTAYLGNSPLTLPAQVTPDLEVAEQGNYIVLTSSCGLRIGFDPHGAQSVATIMVPVSYSEKMIGLCGDCDGNLDEYSLKDGTDVSGEADKYKQISESYEVDDSANSGYTP